MNLEQVNSSSSESFVFAPASRDPRLEQFLTAFPPSLFSESLYRSVELMERYTVELALDLLARLQVFEHLANWRSPTQLCRILGFQPGFRIALTWLLRRVVETGCLEAQADAEVFRLRERPAPLLLGRWREIGLEISPDNAAALDLLDRAASLYPAVARGELSGEQALFGPEGIALWLRYFHNGNLTYAVNNWVTAVLAAECVANSPRLRVLELGAGAGSATTLMLRWFAERGLLSRLERYVVSEPNAFFRRRGQREISQNFRDAPLEWSALDVNEAWSNQGIATGEFDLVFGVNVFHVAQDLLFTLAEAHRSLAPQGWLVLGECVRPYPHQPLYPELVFQLLDSFTAVSLDPAFRPNPGFLTPEQWQAAFTRAGFEQWKIAPDIIRIREMYSHFFTAALCGQCPGHP